MPSKYSNFHGERFAHAVNTSPDHLLIVETRAEHVADWKHALSAINPDLDSSLCLVELAGDVQ